MKLLQVAIVASLIHVTLSQASCSQGETCSERNTSLPSSSMLQASYLQTADESVAESKANPIRKVINMLQPPPPKDQCKDWCKFNDCPDKNNAKDCKTCCFCQADFDFWTAPTWKGKLGNKVTRQKYCDKEDPKAIALSGDCSKVGYSIGHTNLEYKALELCREKAPQGLGGKECRVRSDESVCKGIIPSRTPGSTPAPTDDDTTPNTPTPPGNGDACPAEKTIDHKCKVALIGGCDEIVRGEGTKCNKECGKCVCKNGWKKKEASGITVVGLNPYWNLQYCMPPEKLPGKKYRACVSKEPVPCKDSWKFFMRTFKEPTRFMSFSGKFWCKTDGGWGYLEGQTLDDDEQC